MAEFFTPYHIALLAGAAVLILIIQKGGDFWKWATTPKAPITPGVDSTDPDVLDMLALKRLTARYTRLHCPEGTAAMQTASMHFFHGTGTV